MGFDLSQDSYQSFRNIVGEKTSSIIAWTGAGMSRPAGLPLWSELKERLIQALRSKAERFESENRQKLIDTCDRIENEHNNWLAFEILRKEIGKTSYQDTIRSELSNAVSAPPPIKLQQIMGDRYTWSH